VVTIWIGDAVERTFVAYTTRICTGSGLVFAVSERREWDRDSGAGDGEWAWRIGRADPSVPPTVVLTLGLQLLLDHFYGSSLFHIIALVPADVKLLDGWKAETPRCPGMVL